MITILFFLLFDSRIVVIAQLEGDYKEQYCARKPNNDQHGGDSGNNPNPNTSFEQHG